MHTLIVCRQVGYSIHCLSFGRAVTSFEREISDPDTTVAALYDQDGHQINAYHNPKLFPQPR